MLANGSHVDEHHRHAAQLPRIISLFSGAGGLDLGFEQAGFDLAFAVDISRWAIQTHRRNFAGVLSIAADLIELGPEGILAQLSTVLSDGEPIGVIGGPPCQGFSRANTTADANDPRNKLPLLYLDIVEALQERYEVRFVLFENVLGIRDMKHEEAFAGILDRLRELSFKHNVGEYCALDFGVAQNRRRVIISAFADPAAAVAFQPKTSLRRNLTVSHKIAGLPEPTYFSRNLRQDEIPFHVNHWTMRPRSRRFQETDQTPAGTGRSFKRLEWHLPSPTVAYGHREIHVHPEGHRRLSIFEAMLLQGFPEGFVLEGPLSAQVDQVSNAVPPPMATALAEAAAAALSASENP